jgi:hypothetical protein
VRFLRSSGVTLVTALIAVAVLSLAPNIFDFSRSGPVRPLVMPAFAQLNYPLGPYGNAGFANTALINTATVPAYSMVGLVTGTPTAGATYTTDTAVNLCALFPFVGSQTAGASQYAWDWYIKNTAGGAFTITAAGGTGVTLSGTGTAAQNNMRHFKVVLTSCPPFNLTTPTAAATLFSLETAAF